MVYKRPAEGGLEAFALEVFWALAFWFGKILERKRIAGKLVKGKEWLKGVDKKSAPRTLT
jgi:hypothetical protein